MNEQNLNITKGNEHPEEFNKLDKVKQHYEHKLDRPELREKITDILNNPKNYVNDSFKMGDITYDDYHIDRLKVTDQILALIPDGQEIRKQVKQELCATCDTPLLREGELYQKLEEAKREERERIIELIGGHSSRAV